MVFKFNPPVSLRESVHTHLKDRIVHNELHPGETLSIEQLASELGVSRTPVREALLLLEGDGLVYHAPNHGFVITEIQSLDVKNVYEVRALIEPHAAYSAASVIPNAELETISALFTHTFDDIEQGEYDQCETCDLKLHTLILENAQNSLLTEIATSLMEQSLRIRYLTDTAPGLYAQTIMEEHQAILDALLCRDSGKAHHTMQTHLSNARERTLHQLEIIQNPAQYQAAPKGTV